MVLKHLGRTYALLVASPSQLERQGRPTSVEDLQRLSTVSMSVADGRISWLLVGPEGREFVFHHRPCYTANDLLTLRFAVLKGTGICLLPDYMCHRELQARQLEVVLPGWAPRPAMIHAVFPSRRGLLPAVRCFLDFLGEHVSGESLKCPD
jgi:DNA-binding transcriptional LysR family regulator